MPLYSALIVRLEKSVDCDFELAFKCGYTSTVLGSSYWSRKNSARVLKTLTGPTVDSKGTTTGKLNDIVYELYTRFS